MAGAVKCLSCKHENLNSYGSILRNHVFLKRKTKQQPPPTTEMMVHASKPNADGMDTGRRMGSLAGQPSKLQVRKRPCLKMQGGEQLKNER